MLRERRLAVDQEGADEVELHLLEAIPDRGGDPARPPVVLLHGWPESSRSWRHQLPALADAGWHVVAPDLRGFGRSSCPEGLAPYRMDRVAGDVLAVFDDLGAEQGVVVGHDWGSMVAWDTGRLHPDRCAGILGMSVAPTMWPMQPTRLLEAVSGGSFLYMLYFQEPGVADVELEADVRRSLRMTYWTASGAAAAARDGRPPAAQPREGTGFLDTMSEPPGPIGWLPDDVLDACVADYERSGFRGGLSYYRSLDASWELTKDLGADRLSMPTAFVGGELDVVVAISRGLIDGLAELLPDFRGTTLVPGAGHWVQQEAPAETTAALLAFLATL